MKTKIMLTCALLSYMSMPAFAVGTITGIVTDSSSQPLQGISVQLYNSITGNTITNSGTTDPSGNYSIPNIIAGTYKAIFFGNNAASVPFVHKWNGGAANFADAMPITVINNATVANINATIGPVADPSLNLGHVTNAVAGTVVKIPVTLTASDAAISSVALTITYDPAKILNVTSFDPADPTQTKVPGPAASGKAVMDSIPAPGTYRVELLSTGNTNIIQDGVIVNLFFEIAGDAAGPIALTSAPEAADPGSAKVAIKGTSGSIAY
jgi:hypothetical protein